jgi:hypothetical protein
LVDRSGRSRPAEAAPKYFAEIFPSIRQGTGLRFKERFACT